MKKYAVAMAFGAALLALPSQAGIVFTFTEEGGGVVMRSSGSIDTTRLDLRPDVSGWGGTGIEENGNHDIMGGTVVGGPVNVSFGFSAGTNFSPWASANGPWANDNFSWIVESGLKSFTTYIRIGNVDPQLPGLGIVRADLGPNGVWSPDQQWRNVGASFASLSMNPGTYTVTDANTAEFITFQIGPRTNGVPEPAPLALLSCALLAIGRLAARRRQS